MSKSRKLGWSLWFVVLAILPYTSLIAPERTDHIPFFYSYPQDLLVWLAVGALYVISIWIFALKEWK